MTDDEQARADLQWCIDHNVPPTGFVADPNYPDVTITSIWGDWLKYLINGTLPQGTRVFCHVTLPHTPI